MGHHAAETFLVAADTAMDFPDTPGTDFVRPLGIGGELSAHGNAIHPPAGQLLLNEIGIGQTARGTDG